MGLNLLFVLVLACFSQDVLAMKSQGYEVEKNNDDCPYYPVSSISEEFVVKKQISRSHYSGIMVPDNNVDLDFSVSRCGVVEKAQEIDGRAENKKEKTKNKEQDLDNADGCSCRLI